MSSRTRVGFLQCAPVAPYLEIISIAITTLVINHKSLRREGGGEVERWRVDQRNEFLVQIRRVNKVKNPDTQFKVAWKLVIWNCIIGKCQLYAVTIDSLRLIFEWRSLPMTLRAEFFISNTIRLPCSAVGQSTRSTCSFIAQWPYEYSVRRGYITINLLKTHIISALSAHDIPYNSSQALSLVQVLES